MQKAFCRWYERIERKKAVMLNNTLRIITFMVLAIWFDKWWIVLVSILFLNGGE